jgi:hypothetical protein
MRTEGLLISILICMVKGNAVLDNFEADLGMTGNQLNTAVTIFYVSMIKLQFSNPYHDKVV